VELRLWSLFAPSKQVHQRKGEQGSSAIIFNRLQSSFFRLSPEASNIIRAEGASHPSDHQRDQ
jgi:hypothetical protein